MSAIIDDFELEILKLFKNNGILKIAEVHDQFSSNPTLYPFKSKWEDINVTIFSMNQSGFLRFLNPNDPDLTVSKNTYILTDIGGDVIRINEMERQERNEDADLNRRKLKVDVENAEQTLKSYPFTKWSARVAFCISILVFYLQIASVKKWFPYNSDKPVTASQLPVDLPRNDSLKK